MILEAPERLDYYVPPISISQSVSVEIPHAHWPGSKHKDRLTKAANDYLSSSTYAILHLVDH